MNNNQEHLLQKYPEADKIAYLSLVASIAKADGNLETQEIENIKNSCKQLGISIENTEKVIASLSKPEPENLNAYISQITNSDLRFTLITDMFFLAYADEVLTENEIVEINSFAHQLNIKDEQIKAIREYVEVITKIKDEKENPNNKAKIEEVTKGLENANIPLNAIKGSSGLSGWDVAQFFALFGDLGGAVGGIVALGTGTYYGVKWLGKKIFG
ncbi:MAG: TerB family tellurite resistance protein [Bacteroidetes bacterium]|nr:MAG: TerB family tellurite resistance protein [Bacteroidota bacterium]TAG87572.1 MAG: TerB family tellurite resistance protein [Bacteroidota bacterium]